MQVGETLHKVKIKDVDFKNMPNNEEFYFVLDLAGNKRVHRCGHIKSHPNWEKIKDQDWHLDHIFPLQAFLEHNIKDIKLINCLDNLQPLLGKENISKGDKYNKEQFLNWLSIHK